MAEIIVALDHSTGEEALALVDVLGSDGNFYKISESIIHNTIVFTSTIYVKMFLFFVSYFFFFVFLI